MQMKHYGRKGSISLAVAAVLAYIVFVYSTRREQADQLHYEQGETELRVSNLTHATLTLFKSGATLSDTSRIRSFNGTDIWLSPGNYFLRAEDANRATFVPLSITGYRRGPDEDGSLSVTIRPVPREFPPRLTRNLPEFVYIPGGNSLLGDRLNPREPHYVWLTGFFIAPFEVTNGEFRTFITAPDGYESDSNWTSAGSQWRRTFGSHSSALLTRHASGYSRFGQDDQPLTWVTWYEANAFCRWMTRRIGARKWLYVLPHEAEWEKVARGPDNFDFALGSTISDREESLYNWRKNPDAPVTVVGIADSPAEYIPNRFGVFHMCGNVVEWTQSINRPYNREQPFVDDDRNSDDGAGLRVARGGSWYSASIAYLYIPYRDAFQPEHSSQDIGFRVVAKALP